MLTRWSRLVSHFHSTIPRNCCAHPPYHAPVWDLALAKTAISLALVGYLVMLIPSKAQIVPFMVGTGFTAFAAAAPPALLSLALAFSKRDDSGKVLASLSALATISVTAIGPSVFGAVYVAVLKWWSEFVFLLAALWVASALIPLFCIRLPASDSAISFMPLTRTSPPS